MSLQHDMEEMAQPQHQPEEERTLQQVFEQVS